MQISTQTSWLSDDDLYLFGEGTHSRAYEKMGAHVGEHGGQRGVHFAVWAPNASQVSVIGDFNGWNSQSNFLESAGSSGIWEGFVPDLAPGARYKYHIKSRYRSYEVDKADPYAFSAEVRPQTATRVSDLSAYS
jgi:1,4-alpha-glucan branching enzyme